MAALGATLVGATPAGAANPFERVAAPSPGPDTNILTSVQCAETSCIAVGVSVTPAETPVPLLVRTDDGTRWRRIANPASPTRHIDQITAVSCGSVQGCVAAGRSYTLVPADPNDPFSQLVPRWVVLRFTSTATGFQRYNGPVIGDDWTIDDISCASSRCVFVGSAGSTALIMDGNMRLTPTLPGIRSTLQAVHCVTNRNCTAVGRYYTSRSPAAKAHTLVMHTEDGAHWAYVPTPNPAPSKSDAVLTDVSCVRYSLTCVAVGYVHPAPGAVERAFVLRTRNSASWTRVDTPIAPEEVRLYGVTCPTTTDCTAVGARGTEQSPTTVLLRTSDGRTWSSPSPGSEKAGRLPLAVSCPTIATCVAVGTFDASGGGSPTVLRSLVLRET